MPDTKELTFQAAKTIGELATVLYQGMVQDTRVNGGKFMKFSNEFKAEIAKAEGADSFYDTWVNAMCRKAHGDMFPDDYKFEFIHDALETIASNWEPRRDASDLEEYLGEEVYTHSLLKWLSSNLSRTSYVDEAHDDYGWPSDTGLCGLLTMAQNVERREVLHAVYDALKDAAEEREYNSSDDDDEEEEEPEGE